MNQNILWICTSTQVTTKFHKILLSRFKGFDLTIKRGLMDGSKTLYPPQLVAWGITRNKL